MTELLDDGLHRGDLQEERECPKHTAPRFCCEDGQEKGQEDGKEKRPGGRKVRRTGAYQATHQATHQATRQATMCEFAHGEDVACARRVEGIVEWGAAVGQSVTNICV